MTRSDNKAGSAVRILGARAIRAKNSFPTTTWHRMKGPGPDVVTLSASGTFHGLKLAPGHELVLRCDLGDLPEQYTGEPLEATLDSLYPARVEFDGNQVFEEPGVPVAYGPAMFVVVPKLRAKANGSITLTVRMPDQQPTDGVRLRLTTPSIRMAYEKIDIAWARLAMSDEVAVTPAARALVESASQRALQDGVELQFLEETLSPLHREIAAITVHLIGHSHVDLCWLWRWPDGQEVILRDFRSVLDLMRDYPEFTFSHSQAASYEVVRRRDPAMFEEVLKQIRAGRWEVTATQWIEPDCVMPNGESHVRQLLQGVSYSRDILGVLPDVLHAPDTFGHAGNLPQLAASAGARFYYHHRANPGTDNQWPAYWWEGDDHNHRLLALSTKVYNGGISAGDVAAAAIRAHRAGLADALQFHGVGDHGGGPVRQHLDCLRRLSDVPGLPVARCSTLTAYGNRVRQSGAHLPVHRGESRTIFEGCYTTHADAKSFNRRGESTLVRLETLAAMAGAPLNIDAEWREVLFNQFHDILCGSSIREVYQDQAISDQVLHDKLGTAIDSALVTLEAGVAAGQIAVTNPLSFSQREPVIVTGLTGTGTVQLVDDQGTKTLGQWVEQGLAFIAHVDGFSTRSYVIEPATGANEMLVTESPGPDDQIVDNMPAPASGEAPYLRVETNSFEAWVRRDCGVIVRLVDKNTNRDWVAYGLRRPSDYINGARPELALGVFQVLDESPHAMSAWQHCEVHCETSLISGAQTKIVEQGPVRVVLETTHRVRASTIVQRTICYAELPYIDYETSVDWHEPGDDNVGVPNLKIAFTARLDQCDAWFETPFAAACRPADGQESPALRWADVGGVQGGIALINDSKYGYDALGCRLRLSLVRTGYAPDACSDSGRQTMRYRLLPHAGDWCDAKVVRNAASFNQPLIARLASGTEKLPRAWRPRIGDRDLGEGVQCSSLRRLAGRGVVVRLYEAHGRPGRAVIDNLPDGAQAFDLNTIDDRLGPIELQSGQLILTMRPWEVRTIEITS